MKNMHYRKIISSAAPFCARNSCVKSKFSKKFVKINYNFFSYHRYSFEILDKNVYFIIPNNFAEGRKILQKFLCSVILEKSILGGLSQTTLFISIWRDRILVSSTKLLKMVSSTSLPKNTLPLKIFLEKIFFPTHL